MADERAERAGIDVRSATGDDLPAVMNVLDAAMLEVDASAVGDRMTGADAGVLVAVDEGRVLGACVVDAPGDVDDLDDANGAARAPARVEAIAVRPGRRNQGIGSALVEAAAGRWGPLSAEFDEDLRPFYESLGFEVERADEGRFRGRRG